jgi:hypothetical protein
MRARHTHTQRENVGWGDKSGQRDISVFIGVRGDGLFIIAGKIFTRKLYTTVLYRRRQSF